MRYGLAGWDDAVNALRAADEIAIGCHINPDGDALGSLLGATLGLRQLGKTVYPSWGDEPAVVPFSYRFLSGADTILQPGDVPAVPTFLAVDCGAGDRLGALEALARKAEVLVNVDHHPGNDDFGTINLVSPSASSTAEMIARLLQDLGVEFNKDIATCLYTGVVTDTGRFQYTNSTPETLRIAAELLEYDVPKTDIAQEVYESAPFGYLKLVGHVLERATLFEDEGFVYSWITLADLEETGVARDETDQLIDLIRSTRAAEVAAMFKEEPEGEWRVSMRSKGPRSVGEIARANGGGGHELAAGFTAPTLEGGVAAIRNALR